MVIKTTLKTTVNTIIFMKHWDWTLEHAAE